MATKAQQLYVFLNDTPMGVLARGLGGKLSFQYNDDYLNSAYAIPLSLSIPLDDRQYRHEKLHSWLWGLLPDNELILARWAQRFQVSPTNCFGLLEGMGEDCAGAVRFIRTENLEQVSAGGRQKLSDSDIEQRLLDLRKDPAMGREPADRGQFSLAGAQSKTALQRCGKTWYVPWGREPTTHILKPPRPDIAGHVENEHFCLKLAEALGLSVAKSEVLHFGQEAAIVVERYDRVLIQQKLMRVHQEDSCQALGVHPAKKYQSDGGPDMIKLMELMNRSSQPVQDRRRLMEALVYNYLIIGTDAHAKNYSLLLGRDSQVRLAKLYDIASFLPYAARRKDCRFAMKIGSYYKDAQIQPRHFEKTARACEFSSSELLQMVRNQAEKLPDAAGEIMHSMAEQGVTHPILDELVEGLGLRAKQVLAEL